MDQSPHPSVVGERLRRAGVAAWSLIGIFIVVAVLFWLLLKVRIIFAPLVLAMLIIYVLNPPITYLAKRGLPRSVSAIGVYIAGITLAVLIGIALIPFASDQIGSFADDWPEFRQELVVFSQDTADSLNETFGLSLDASGVPCLLGDTEKTDGTDCGDVFEGLRENLTGSRERLTELGLTVLEAIVVFILAPLIALYMLIDLPQLKRDVLNLFPERMRPEARDVGQKLARAVGGFFRGQLVVALIVGVLSALGFWLIGLPFWLVIGAIAGFFNLIPLVGPFVGGGIGFLVGVVTGGVGLGLQAALVELVVQQLDNHIISPQVMKRTVRLHPATVALALLAGGALAGFWGVLLGVPAVAVGKILLGHIWATRILGVEVTPFNSSRGSPAISELKEIEP